MLKKSLALLLTLVMVLSLAPINAFAAETTGYDTVQLPAKLPKAVYLDGYITNYDGYHAFGIIANNVFEEIPENSTTQNYLFNDVSAALVAAQTHTYFFAQDDTNYYFGIKLDRKSVNVDGYNYFTAQQTLDFKFGFDESNVITISLPVKYNSTLTVSNSKLEVTPGLTGNKAPSYFNTEPAYANSSTFDTTSENGAYATGRFEDNRTLNEGSVLGNAGASVAGANVFTYEFSISKSSVETIIGKAAPSSIYFQASTTKARYGSMNDINLSAMLECDSYNATFNLGTKNAPAKVEFVVVDANHEHNYVENPIDDFLVNKGTWAAQDGKGYYYPINPTARLACGERAEYYKSCSICRAAGTEKFYGEAKAHSYVMRGDIVSSEITACNAANKSRIEYEYGCAWCKDVKVLPWGDYSHYIVNTDVKLNQRSYAACGRAGCDFQGLVHRCNVGNHAASNTKYDPKTVVIPATCTTPGVTLYQCAKYLGFSYCTQMKTEKTADALGHNEEPIPAVDATCTSTGLTAGVKCSECNDILTEQTVVDKLAHTPAEKAVVENDNASTCTKAGSYDEVVYCSVCNTELNRVTKAKDLADHTPADKAIVENEIKATCTATGSYDSVIYCSVCNTELDRETVTTEMVAHTPAEAVVENDNASTCTVAGSYDEVVYCSVCNTELNRVTKAKDLAAHTPAEAVVENDNASTCKVAGSYDEVVYCSVCEAEISRETKAKELVAHTEEAIPAVDAECGKTGLTAGVKCSVCGDILTAQEETPALEHNYDAVVTDPDFGKQGYTTHTCSNCGDVYVDSYVDAKVAVASVGGVNYETLQAAIDAAQAGETVVLLADVELDTYIIVRNTITLDLNGNTITYTGDAGLGAIYVAATGDLTVGNGEVIATNDDAIGVYGKVTVESGTFTGAKLDEYDCAGLCTFYYNETTYGTAVINGGTFNRIHNCGVMTINGGVVTECVDNTHKLTVVGGVIAELVVGEADYAPVFGTVTEIVNGIIDSIDAAAQIGGNSYATVADAIAAAKENDVVTLTADCEAEVIMVPAGATLDLNGNTLKVESFFAFGNIVDGTEGGESLLVVAIDACVLDPTNTFLSVYDTTGEESGYRFYSFELPILNRAGNDENETRFGVRLTFANANAYEVIKSSADTGLAVGLTLKIEGYEDFVMTYKYSTLLEYVNLMQTTDLTTGTPVMAVTIKGIANLEAGITIKAYTTVASATGVSSIGDISADVTVG